MKTETERNKQQPVTHLFVQIRKLKHMQAARKKLLTKTNCTQQCNNNKDFPLRGDNNNDCVVQSKHTTSAWHGQCNATITARLNKVNVLTCGIGVVKQSIKVIEFFFLIKEVTQSATRQQGNSKCPNLKTKTIKYNPLYFCCWRV